MLKMTTGADFDQFTIVTRQGIVIFTGSSGDPKEYSVYLIRVSFARKATRCSHSIQPDSGENPLPGREIWGTLGGARLAGNPHGHGDEQFSQGRSFGVIALFFCSRTGTSGGISIKFREHLLSLEGFLGAFIIILGSSALYLGLF